MNLWKRFFGRPEDGQTHNPRVFELDAALYDSLQELALREKRPPQELAARLLQDALEERRMADGGLAKWRSLPPREREVAALICLNLTDRQIAARLTISPETVKSHAHSILSKFGVRNRQELRQRLAQWDFTPLFEKPAR